MASRILISADMEGATATATVADVTPGTTAYTGTLALWTQEINTVAESLFDSGVTDVIVTDAHDSGSNLQLAHLDPRISLVHGRSRTFGMMEGIDTRIDGVVFLGYHGAAGSSGVLSHSFISAGIHELKVDGEPAGEGTVNAVLARYFQAPIIMVTGDDAAAAEAERYAPEAERVVVKQALSRYCAATRPVEWVRSALAASAAVAMHRLEGGARETSAPPTSVCLEVEFSSEACALAASAVPGARLVGGRHITFCHTDIPTWYRAVGAMWTLARASQDWPYG
jgi:D-amino peptidase